MGGRIRHRYSRVRAEGSVRDTEDREGLLILYLDLTFVWGGCTAGDRFSVPTLESWSHIQGVSGLGGCFSGVLGSGSSAVLYRYPGPG